MRYANLFDFWFDKRQRYIIFTHAQFCQFNFGLRKLILFYFYQVWCLEKLVNLQKFCGRHSKVFVGILVFPLFSKPGIQYLWQGEIGVCKILVPIKVVPVKNDNFLHPKFELHRCQQMNGFLYWCSFYWKTIWCIY